MPQTSQTPCPNCGRLTAGRFCSECGTPVTPGACPRCGKQLAPATKFCPECGTSLGAGPTPGRSNLLPWVVGAGLLVVILALVARQNSAGSSGAEAAPLASAPGTPPDLSQMSPRERFDRLFNRVMQASEDGDTAQVAQFAPMALLAYNDLGPVDADARYHAAMLRIQTGDPVGAQFLADSILADHPNHLFGLLIEGALARWNQDQRGLATVNAAFLAAYDAELASGRQEYREHSTALENFRTQAEEPAPKP